MGQLVLKAVVVMLFALSGLLTLRRWLHKRNAFDAQVPPGVRTRTPLTKAQRRRRRKRRR